MQTAASIAHSRDLKNFHSLLRSGGLSLLSGSCIHPLKIRENPHQRFAASPPSKMLTLENDLSAAHFRDQLTNLANRYRRATTKGIDVNFIELALHFDQVMTRQSHPDRFESDTAGDVEKDDGQRDREPRLAVDHLVEAGVARIVVVDRVAVVTVDIEHLSLEVAEQKDGRLPRADSRAGPVRQLVKLTQIAININLRVVFQRDEQSSVRDVRSVDLVLRELFEASSRLGRVDVDRFRHGLGSVATGHEIRDRPVECNG